MSPRCVTCTKAISYAAISRTYMDENDEKKRANTLEIKKAYREIAK